ncbi:putative Altered inheritance of mitochondria protein 3 [Glarea lozoyensis 74030]|uniref:Putative Altered inheritance of mitochondria protein 3 n=1 Tax=Glarea lozoyensis (strain ATCC 74030 / MF5533) TaxID=1104152 RepID=H0EHW4_GLAL7|nr:putative Altered inheritance of mitochondria protein 3 [Glarea lozoyensis 74030]
MSKFKDIAKGGWHPEKGKDGKTRSLRGESKGINTVAGWMGKGKDPNEEARDHVSRPLSTLKDPYAFGPPPKNVNYHGGAALPNQITPDTRGLGAPLSREEIEAKRQAEEAEAQREAEEAAKPKGPPVPFRADTTGLSTSHLPPPPGRKDGADGRLPLALPEPEPRKPTSGRAPLPLPSGKAQPPGLPPRLPPRQNSSPMPSPPLATRPPRPQPESHKGILNQNSLNNLGNAGISVAGLGIGGKEKESQQTSTDSRSPVIPAARASNPQLGELQSRFSRLSPKPQGADAPSQGTTFAQKQSALKTASSFRNDPSSVSFSDAKAAAGTANNFRERHGEQVKSGWQSANKLNSKYGIGMAASPNNAQAPAPPQELTNSNGSYNTSFSSAAAVIAKKKPPPPPPKKKPALASPVVGHDPSLPPPIPLASKPKPSAPVPLDLDLDLASLWFAQSPPVFPPRTIDRSKFIYATTRGYVQKGVRVTHTFSAVLQDNGTLGRTKVQLTWDQNYPEGVQSKQRYFPPPPPLSRAGLEDCQERYAYPLASWCESQMGKQVGNGECWTLASDGLKAVAATCSASGQEPYPNPGRSVLEAGVGRGDIVQILSAHFKSKDGRRQAWAGDPDHTAVVTSVDRNGVLKVVEQNVGGVKRVQPGSYDLSEMFKGEVRIFRAVGESWLGPLDPQWE